MTDDAKIKIIIDSLRDNALEDIKRAAMGGSKIGAFILCSCLIDAVAGFTKGGDTQGADYKTCIGKYLPTYNGQNLYEDLRCKLVHSYSEGGSYWFTDSKPNLHHTKHMDGKIIVNLETFITEIETALTAYSNELTNTTNFALRAKAVKRFDGNGIIQVVASSGGVKSSMMPSLSGKT